MRLHVAVPLIALLFLPAPVHAEDPLAMAEAIADDTVRILFTTGDEFVAAEMPLCDPREMKEGETLLGHVRSDCFATVEVEEDVGPFGLGPECPVAIVRVFPGVPTANVTPNIPCALDYGVGTVAIVLEKLPVTVEIEE